MRRRSRSTVGRSEGQYDFTPRPPRSTITRSTGSRCSWSDCSPLAFLAWLHLVERRSSQCSPRDHCSTQARPPRQGGSFRSGQHRWFLILPDMLKNSPMLKRPLGAKGLGTGRGKNAMIRAGGNSLVSLILFLVVVRGRARPIVRGRGATGGPAAGRAFGRY
ncbi:hypothetical protein CSKR_109414 [Clonorchis sinensis]|uniref:Uncharacterized protein n=1 Tax=Clonorchis sinensis TaxID=79923 RepID=A0A3R7CEX6_CLOSI|nr:hypothetical protein CSKR_109414 [Clonorchis sinensis]